MHLLEDQESKSYAQFFLHAMPCVFQVKDVNEAPFLEGKSSNEIVIEVKEDAAVSSEVGRILAGDPDRNDTLRVEGQQSSDVLKIGAVTCAQTKVGKTWFAKIQG